MLMAESGINILLRSRDLLILTDGMWDGFKIYSGMRDEKQ